MALEFLHLFSHSSLIGLIEKCGGDLEQLDFCWEAGGSCGEPAGVESIQEAATFGHTPMPPSSADVRRRCFDWAVNRLTTSLPRVVAFCGDTVTPTTPVSSSIRIKVDVNSTRNKLYSVVAKSMRQSVSDWVRSVLPRAWVV